MEGNARIYLLHIFYHFSLSILPVLLFPKKQKTKTESVTSTLVTKIKSFEFVPANDIW